MHECAVPDATTTDIPDLETEECGDGDADVEEEFVWIMRWWDPRTIDCYVDGTDNYLSGTAICIDDEYDGMFFPGLLWEDRDGVFSQDDAEWTDALCYDEEETLVEDCETDYLTLLAAFNSDLDADELEELGLDATGLALLLNEYEVALFAEDYAALDAAVCAGLTEDECDLLDFSAFCDADVETMFASAGETFGRAEITDFVAFLDAFTDDVTGDVTGDIDFLFSMCGGALDDTSASLFDSISTVLDLALLDASLFTYDATCDPTLLPDVPAEVDAAGLLLGLGLPGCAECDTSATNIGEIAGLTCSDAATIADITPEPQVVAPPTPAVVPTPVVPTPVVPVSTTVDCEEDEEEDDDGECVEISAHSFTLGFSILAVLAALLN